MSASGKLATSKHPGHASAIRVLQQHGKSFHFAGKFLSGEQLRDAAQLYRFCRYLDDLVDHATDREQAEQSLHRVAQDLRNRTSSDPVVESFLRLAHRRACRFDAAHQLVLGQQSDLRDVRIRDDAELKQYCYRVAGAVGILMCGVLGVRDPRAFPYAIDLGIGMQLTNIARDVSEDARRGRIYLPATLLGDIPAERIAEGSPKARPVLVRAVQALLADADRYYQSGESGLSFLPIRARFAIFMASRIYHAIGGALRRRGFATWQGRVTVSLPRKGVIATRTACEFLSRSCLSDLPKRHDANLHVQLAGCPGADVSEERRQ